MRIRGQVLSKHSINAHYCYNYSQIQSHRLSGEISRRQRRGENSPGLGDFGAGERGPGWGPGVWASIQVAGGSQHVPDHTVCL